MKKCASCGEKKPLTAYYKHSGMADGRLNTCKACKRSYQSKKEASLRKENPEWVKKERARQREKYYRLNYKEKNNSHNYKATDNYRKKYPEKYKAVIASQRIPCPDGCHRHHWSYRREHRKDVIIIDNKTHAYIHRYLLYDQKKKVFRAMDGRILDTKNKHKNYISGVVMTADEKEINIILQ